MMENTSHLPFGCVAKAQPFALFRAAGSGRRAAFLLVERKFWQFARQAHGIFHNMVEYWWQFARRK